MSQRGARGTLKFLYSEKDSLMSIENDECIEFSLSQKDTPIHKRVAEIPRPEIPLVALTPKKTLLERLPLSNTTSAMTRVIGGVRLETEASRQRMISQWNVKNVYKHVMTDPLYKNSIFNMASTFILGGLGFVFWIIIAQLYKAENVGIATTLISILTLLSSFTLLGLNVSLNRYLPKSTNKNELINSSF